MAMTKAQKKKQTMEALAGGNKVRLARAKLKRDIFSGTLDFKQALAAPESQNARLEAIVCANKNWGAARARKLMRRIEMPFTRLQARVRDLSAREKRLIVKGVKDPKWVLPQADEPPISPEPQGQPAERKRKEKEARWIEGPGFVKWLKETAPGSYTYYRNRSSNNSSREDANYAHRLPHWKKGAYADIYTIDRFLTHIGLHLSMVPEELFTTAKPKGKKAE